MCSWFIQVVQDKKFYFHLFITIELSKMEYPQSFNVSAYTASVFEHTRSSACNNEIHVLKSNSKYR